MTPFERLFGFSPRTGSCIFCARKLIPEVDTDFAVCNDCWTATFACPICKDETGECIHQQDTECISDLSHQYHSHDDPEQGTYVEFLDGS